MTKRSNFPSVSRRRLLQTLGGSGTIALSGCIGGDDNSDSETPTTEEDTSTPVQTTETPDYALPESKHVDPESFVREWMLVPPSDTLQATAYSPSQASKKYGTTYAEIFGLDAVYDPFEFYDDDIPETFLQVKDNQWSSIMKVDQLPRSITKGNISQQLREAEYYKEREMGDFDIYRGRGGSGPPRAIGQERHIVSHPIANGDDDSAMQYMDNFLSQRVEGELQPGVHTTTLLDSLNVKDSVTLRKAEFTNLVVGVKESRQPIIGAASVDMENGDKYGAWVFNEEQTAENVHTIKQADDLSGGYDELNQDGRVITAQGTYNEDEMGYERAQISAPII